MKIFYSLDFSQKDNNYLLVTAEIVFNEYYSDELTMILPVWSPGSYLVREYATHLDCFQVFSESGPLNFEKIKKNQWKIKLNPGIKKFNVSYRLYCHENSVRTNFIDDLHALIVPPATFLIPLEKRQADYFEVRVNLPPDWTKVVTGLSQVENHLDRFYATDPDDFLDCPLEIGEFPVFEFYIFGKKHRLAMIGPKIYQEELLLADLKKVIEETSLVIGEVPYDDYTFITHLTSGSTGGIEHKNSTILHFNRWDFNDPEKYKTSWLSLVSHEYFHLWNVKRIKPTELSDFDYNNENYTRLLWLSEGFTSYFDDLVLRRAGIYSEDEYLNVLCGLFERLIKVPGRFYESLEDSSFDAWIKLYRKHDNTNNQNISYYVKGAQFGWALDFIIRKYSGNQKNLDDLFKMLWIDYKNDPRIGYDKETVINYAEQLCERDLRSLFQEFLTETKEIDYNLFLDFAGLQLKFDNKVKPTFGLTVSEEKGRLLCSYVKDQGPAFRAGLMPGDEIISLNGYRVNLGNYNKFISQTKVDAEVAFLISRDERICQKNVLVSSSDPDRARICKIEKPTAEQTEFYYQWIGKYK